MTGAAIGCLLLYVELCTWFKYRTFMLNAWNIMCEEGLDAFTKWMNNLCMYLCKIIYEWEKERS